MFKIGQTVKNISRDSKRYGETAKVINTNGTAIEVEYEDGYIGSANTGSKYYQVVNGGNTSNGIKSEVEKMDVIKTIKRMALAVGNPNKLKLMDAGLLTECGTYTDDAVTAVTQALCESEASQAQLLAIAEAIIAERKAKKTCNN